MEQSGGSTLTLLHTHPETTGGRTSAPPAATASAGPAAPTEAGGRIERPVPAVLQKSTGGGGKP